MSNHHPKSHQPPHLFLDDTIYFISVHTHDNLFLFNDNRKEELIRLIIKLIKQYNYGLFAYVILQNHYHLLLRVSNAQHLSDLFKNLHGGLSFNWNLEDKSRGRTIFQNYWDYCIRDEKDFFTHFNYIHQNPIKHRLVTSLEELKIYKFCSYNKWLIKMGEEWMSEILENYPIINYIIPND